MRLILNLFRFSNDGCWVLGKIHGLSEEVYVEGTNDFKETEVWEAISKR